MLQALEHIRRMRGGAQSQLMRCDDGRYYVVKFKNNPQGLRTLINELIGTRLAAKIGLPTPSAAIVNVSEALVAYSEDLSIALRRSISPCLPGLQFGSQYPDVSPGAVVLDFIPDQELKSVPNLSDFFGMLAFDKWTCNTDSRQVVYHRSDGASPRALMIDEGFCFGADRWDFGDSPIQGLYFRHGVYQSVQTIESFEPWLTRIETGVCLKTLECVLNEVPQEWYDDDRDALEKMLAKLFRRRNRVRDLLNATCKALPDAFPNWRQTISCMAARTGS